MQYALIILVQGFCRLKIKITQFPGGFCLKTIARLFPERSANFYSASFSQERIQESSLQYSTLHSLP